MCAAHCTFKSFWPTVDWARVKSNNGLKTGFIICYSFSFVLLFILVEGQRILFLEETLRFVVYVCVCFGLVVGTAVDKSRNGLEEGRNGTHGRRMLTSWVQ